MLVEHTFEAVFAIGSNKSYRKLTQMDLHFDVGALFIAVFTVYERLTSYGMIPDEMMIAVMCILLI